MNMLFIKTNGTGLADFRKWTGYSQRNFSKVLKERGMTENTSVATIQRYEKEGFPTEGDGFIWLSKAKKALAPEIEKQEIKINYNGKVLQ